MYSSMLHWIIAEQFENVVGKWQGKKENTSQLGLHVGIEVSSKDDYEVGNQYHSFHLFIYAPMNYVYVVCQERWVDEKGDVHTKPMDLLTYHDSCWRDAISTFFWEKRDVASGWRSFDILGHTDVVEISNDQQKYCGELDHMRQNRRKEYENGERPDVENPFHLGDDMYDYWKSRTKKVTYTIE